MQADETGRSRSRSPHVVKASDVYSSLNGCVQAPVLSLDVRPTVAGEGEEPALVLLATCMDGVHAIVHVNVEDGGMLKMDIVHRAKVRCSSESRAERAGQCLHPLVHVT